MKNLFISLSVFFAFTVAASAQEMQDQLDQQPTQPTERQVQRDAKVAQRQDEAVKEADKLREKDKTEQKKQATKDKKKRTITPSTNKKTSTAPGKQ